MGLASELGVLLVFISGDLVFNLLIVVFLHLAQLSNAKLHVKEELKDLRNKL